MSDPYCVECWKDDHAKEKADDRLGLTTCSPSSKSPTTTKMNDTPETDKEHEIAKSCGFPLMVQADFARKMERQRDRYLNALRGVLASSHERNNRNRATAPVAISEGQNDETL